jgi:ureidoglycolate lyase
VSAPTPEPLIPEPLAAATFAPYGRVLEADPAHAQGINAGWTTRFHALAQVEAEGAPAILSIFRGRVRPLAVELLERHPRGSQAFVPLGGRPWLVVVADGPEARPRAFLARGDQGAQIARGVWHAPLMPLIAQDFLVADRAEPEANLETATLPEPVAVTL